MNPIRSTIAAWRRMRLNMAEADLQFLEARAPAVIDEQRRRVELLRYRAGAGPMPASSEAVRLRIEHRAKHTLLNC